jgi:hypothetical protein
MIRRYILLVGSVLALVGCKNLQTVQSLSATLVSASQSLDLVSGEIKASCIRHRQFDSQEECGDQTKTSEGLLAADQLLGRYFTALGDAAGGKPADPAAGLEDLKASVDAIPKINTSEVDAAAGLAETIASAITLGAREKAVRDLIDRGGPHAKAVVAMLKARVPRALNTALDGEQTSLSSKFIGYTGNAFGRDLKDSCANGPSVADFPSGLNFLLALEYCRRNSAISAKQAAVKDYLAALDNIDKTLDVLASSKSDLTATQLIGQLRDQVGALKTNIEAVQAAFAQGAGK